MNERMLEVYRRLLAAYGSQGWWPRAESPFEVIVGAILVQNTAWANAERALDRLRAAGALDSDGIRRLSETDLAELVRPSGYFNAKARKLKAFVAMLDDAYGGDLDRLLGLSMDELRARLLAAWGIGPETADDIVLYAAGHPSFVIDAYTVRLFSRLGITADRDRYDAWRSLFMEHLPPDTALFNEYHALIVTHGHHTCRKTPRCGGCPLRDLCPTGHTPPRPFLRSAGIPLARPRRTRTPRRARRGEGETG